MSTKNENSIVESWQSRIIKALIGKTIVDTRYLTGNEMNALGWSNRSLVIIFQDGSFIYPTSDDEANDAGAIHTSFTDLPIIPVI